MKMLAIILSLIAMVSAEAHAELVLCDWKQVKHNPDHTYLYTEPLHLCVGKLVFNQALDNQQIDDMKKALDLKSLALDEANWRAQLWQKTSTELDMKINEVKSQESKANWITFGLGFLTASLLIYGASKISNR